MKKNIIHYEFEKKNGFRNKLFNNQKMSAETPAKILEAANVTSTPTEILDKASENCKHSMQIFQNMKEKFLESVPEEEAAAYQRFGEKFHSSFDVNTGNPVDLSNICMEEALSYVVQGLNAGLHPKFITEDEDALLQAAYGEQWYEKWGYKNKTDIE